MKKIIIGVALIGIASLGFVFLNDFSALNNRIQTKQITKNFSKKSGTCGCIIVMKHSNLLIVFSCLFFFITNCFLFISQTRNH